MVLQCFGRLLLGKLRSLDKFEVVDKFGLMGKFLWPDKLLIRSDFQILLEKS